MVTDNTRAPTGKVTRFVSRAGTVGQLFRHFTGRGRLFMLPVILFILISAVLLVLAGGLSYVAPFVYAIF
ncbi:MAG: DUF5989 family protein [Caulobacteraceae bacterium]